MTLNAIQIQVQKRGEKPGGFAMFACLRHEKPMRIYADDDQRRIFIRPWFQRTIKVDTLYPNRIYRPTIDY
jgi:hypothetical protein